MIKDYNSLSRGWPRRPRSSSEVSPPHWIRLFNTNCFLKKNKTIAVRCLFLINGCQLHIHKNVLHSPLFLTFHVCFECWNYPKSWKLKKQILFMFPQPEVVFKSRKGTALKITRIDKYSLWLLYYYKTLFLF